MRGGPRNVRRPVCAESHEILSYRHAGTGKHERSAAEDSPQKDLEPPIPADVVERAPYDVGTMEFLSSSPFLPLPPLPPVVYPPRQAGGGGGRHFRRARPGRRKEDPLRSSRRGGGP